MRCPVNHSSDFRIIVIVEHGNRLDASERNKTAFFIYLSVVRRRFMNKYFLLIAVEKIGQVYQNKVVRWGGGVHFYFLIEVLF